MRIPRSDALTRFAIDDVLFAPSSIAVNTSSSTADFNAADLWYANSVSKIKSADGIVCADMALLPKEPLLYRSQTSSALRGRAQGMSEEMRLLALDLLV